MLQVKNANGEWIDVGEIKAGGVIEYREKPEKKPDVSLFYYASPRGNGVAPYVSWNGVAKFANLKLTFSGDNGELIKAEVIK